MSFIDRPASHARAHAENQPCACHGRTEAELAAPYALFVYLFFVVLPLGALIWMAMTA